LDFLLLDQAVAVAGQDLRFQAGMAATEGFQQEAVAVGAQHEAEQHLERVEQGAMVSQ
jgi:hypothetical protein